MQVFIFDVALRKFVRRNLQESCGMPDFLRFGGAGNFQAKLKQFRFMKLLRQFAELPRRAKVSLLMALGVLLAVRLALWVGPLSLAEPFHAKSSSTLAVLCSFPAEQMCWAVLAGARRIPQATCLTQTIALRLLLALSGRPSQIRIGVAKDAEGRFQSPAWLEYQNKVLLGGHEDLALPDHDHDPSRRGPGDAGANWMNTSVSLLSRVRPNQRVLFQTLDREAVLLHLESGIYFGLNQVGMDCWRLLGESDSLDQVADGIATLYGVPKEQSQADLMVLVAQMLEHNLVTVA